MRLRDYFEISKEIIKKIITMRRDEFINIGKTD